MSSLKYWVVAVPSEGKGEQDSVLKLKHAVERMSTHHPMKFPQLRVGTLDSLIALSDDLVKKDQDTSSALDKISKMYHDFVEGKEEVLYVDRKHPETYVETFKWNTQQFVPTDSLQKIVDNITANVSQNLEVLSKIQMTITAYRTKIQALDRTATGSLAFRDLHEFVKRSEWIDGPHLTSCLLAVPIARLDNFTETYENINECTEAKKILKNWAEFQSIEDDEKEQKQIGDKMIRVQEQAEMLKKLDGCPIAIPNSAIELAKDENFVLYRVVVLRSCHDLFAHLARSCSFVVRKFNIDDIAVKVDKKQLVDLNKKMDKERDRLVLLCRSYYSEVFAGYMHLVLIRAFVESVLRYGLPINFTINFLKPQPGITARLKKTLGGLYAHLQNSATKTPSRKKGKKAAGGEAAAIDYSGLGSDFRPYVFSQINVSY